MILGLGIDAVEIHRFEDWHNYSRARLLKIFSEEEIAYCLSVKEKSAERFAARFAAKEACYKSVSKLTKISFLEFGTKVKIFKKKNGEPYIVLDKTVLNRRGIEFLISITHTSTTAIVSVVAYKSNRDEYMKNIKEIFLVLVVALGCLVYKSNIFSVLMSKWFYTNFSAQTIVAMNLFPIAILIVVMSLVVLTRKKRR